MATNISGTMVYNGHIYHIVSSDELGSSAQERWENAKIHCANLGGHLAVINDANENTALFNYMKSLGINSAYFGLSDAAQEGTWTWVDGTPLTYSNWASGEPSNGDNADHPENYGMFYWQFNDGTWNDGDFTDALTDNGGEYFICEVDNVTPVPGDNFVLENSFTGSNGHTYYLISTSVESGATAWNDANTWLNGYYGAHLAVINDSAENAELFNFMLGTTTTGLNNSGVPVTLAGVQEAYFGLSDAAQEGTWTWIDGTALDETIYTNGTPWSDGEPNALSAEENYGMFFAGLNSVGNWNDGDVAFPNPYYMDIRKIFFLGEAETSAVDNASNYDFVFLYDISGSMDTYIDRVNGIAENFTQQLTARGLSGCRVAVGEFGSVDDISFYPMGNSFFTTDLTAFKDATAQAADKANNGGKEEYGLTAIHRAIYELGLNPLAQKRFIVLTDEGYQENNGGADSESADLTTVLGELGATGIVVDVIGKTNTSEQGCQYEWEPLANATGGNFYDINGDYNAIFDDISGKVAGKEDVPFFGDNSLSGTIQLAQWGYGFEPPADFPLYPQNNNF